jgi:hypothetical protein
VDLWQVRFDLERGGKMIATNMKVFTPIGKGTVDGCYVVLDGNGNVIVTGVGVRLPVDQNTSEHLKKSNCMTPLAHFNGLWVFDEKDLR